MSAAEKPLRLERVEVKIEPYPNLIRTRMSVTVAGPGKSLGDGTWLGGREIQVQTEASAPGIDMREQLKETLARALDELAALS